MKECRVSGGIGFTGVPSWCDALRVIVEEKCIAVTTAYRDKPYRRAYCTEPAKSVHVYFANSIGDEVGYWTECVRNLIIFDTPRKVDSSFMRGVVFLNLPGIPAA